MKYMVSLTASLLSVIISMAQSDTCPPVVKEDIRFMREEEKLARDVYDSLYAKWSLTPFSNIRSSEQNHMDQMKSLILRFNLSDPVASTNDRPGEYKNVSLSKLYTEMIRLGSKSVVDALTAGARIEETDIKDLADRSAHTTDKVVLQVYENLRLASERHLNALVRNLRKNGVKYQPAILSKEYFDTIIAD